MRTGTVKHGIKKRGLEKCLDVSKLDVLLYEFVSELS
jgi:hypothetical protein